MSRKFHIYYHNDHDGIVSAAIATSFIKTFGAPFDIFYNMIDYNTILNFEHITLEEGEQVFFLDYSFSNKYNLNQFINLLKRRKYGSQVIWIDHHKTSIGILEEYSIYGIRKIGLCGAALTYLYLYHQEDGDLFESESFHNDEIIPKFLKYIDDYDCWKKLYRETNDFHYGFNISDPTSEKITELLDNRKMPTGEPVNTLLIGSIICAGKEVQKYLDFENKEYHVDMYGFEYILPKKHGGYKCFCMNRKGNSLMFGNKIKQYDAVIPFYFNGSRWTYSIFTEKDNVNCEAVAKSYGGGGHLKAAGWTSKKLIFKNKSIFKRIINNIKRN